MKNISWVYYILNVLILLHPIHLLGQEVGFNSYTNVLNFIEGTIGQATCTADMNGDGLDDFTRVSLEGIHINFQKENGSFNYNFFEKKIEVLPIYSICAGDLNNDGYNDLVFGGKDKVSFLVYNVALQHYEEQVMPQNITCQRSTLFDIDKDGDLDAFICNDAGKSLCFANNGNGVMTLDQNILSTSNLAGNYSAIWVDYNNDGNADLYISKCLADAQPGDPRRTNLLYKNNGNGTFVEVAAQAGINDNAQSWSTVFEDFDHDGDFDAFIINHDEKNRLYRNNGDGTFTDIIAESGIDAFDLGAYENSVGDFNNDGHIDIISDLKNQLYLSNGDLTFVPNPLPFIPYAIADFNNDGHLDVTSRNTFNINKGNDNHWIKVILTGVESNRNGVGATVTVKSGGLTQIKELRAGESYSPMHSLNLHFGLGRSSMVEELIVRWPSGIVSTLSQLQVDSIYNIVEGTCQLPVYKIVGDDVLLCPGESITLGIEQANLKYRWNIGDTTQLIKTKNPGLFALIYEDTMHCRGITKVIVKKADIDFPSIDSKTTDSILCNGQMTHLKTSNSDTVLWSTGVRSSDLLIQEDGLYFFTVDSVCTAGKFHSDSISIQYIDINSPLVTSIEYFQDSVLIGVDGQNCLWYENEFSTIPIYTDCTIKIKKPENEKTLFVESLESEPYASFFCGKKSDKGFKNISSIPRQLFFTVHEDMVIETIDIYKKNKTDDFTEISILSMTSGNKWSKKFLAEPGLNTLNTSCLLRAGSYSMYTNDTTLFMNIGPIDYPFPIGNFGQIDSANVSLNFYPFFYNWKVRKADKICTSKRVPVQVSPLKTSDLESAVKMYPNPSNDVLNINVTTNIDWSVKLLDITGKTIFHVPDVSREHLEIPLHQFSKGTYIVKVYQGGEIYCKKFVVL